MMKERDDHTKAAPVSCRAPAWVGTKQNTGVREQTKKSQQTTKHETREVVEKEQA
jgi:hypothetical protein